MFVLDPPMTFGGGALKILGRGIGAEKLFFFKLVKGFSWWGSENMFSTEFVPEGIVWLKMY